MLPKRRVYLVIVMSLITVFIAGCASEYEVEVQIDPEEAGKIEGEGNAADEMKSLAEQA